MTIEKPMPSPKIWTAITAICVGLLWLPNFFVVTEAADLRSAQWSEAIAYGGLFWAVWFAVLKKAWLATMLAVIPATWWTGSLFLRIKYQVPINQTFLGMTFDTPSGEIVDFFLSYGWSWLLLSLLAPITVLILSFYLIRHPVTWTHCSRHMVWLSGLLIVILMYGIIDHPEPEPAVFLEKDQKIDPFLADTPRLWLDRLGSVYPLDFPMAALQVYQNTQKTQKLRTGLPEIQLEKDSGMSEKPDVVIMVIGESSRVDHWGLFGYARQTTPLLQKQRGILIFSDVVTQSLATRTAVPSLVSRKPFLLPDGAAQQDVEPSILKMFEKAGYETYWLSNQSRSGFFENPIAFYAADAKYHNYLNPSSYSALGVYDSVVVEKTKKILKDGTSQMMIVIHTMGSHFNYAHRYPPEFDQYQPSLIPRINVKRNGEGAELDQIKNSYDNSILYTDFILNSLIDAIRQKSENSVLVYVSDHAEDIGDTACGYSDIGRRSSAAFRVPALIWLGPEYVRKNPAIAAQLSTQTHLPHVSTVMPQTLLDLALIKVAGARSPSLMDLDHGRPRRVFTSRGSWVDFDVAERTNKCDVR